MSDDPHYIFLIDDDSDDRDLFKDARKEIPTTPRVLIVNNRIQPMYHFDNDNGKASNAILSNLNLRIRSREECLQKIQEISRFESLPLVIYTISLVQQLADRLKAIGPDFCAQKISSFSLIAFFPQRSILKFMNLNISDFEEIDFIIKENK